MNSLVKYEDSKNQVVVTSKEIARNFGKEHKHVLRDIENLVAQNWAAKSMFYETTYENRGKLYPMYLMNRDGFSLLVMGFTGKDALSWKVKYINAFNEMELKLNSPEFIVKRAMTYLQDKCYKLELEVKENKPKVTFANTVIACEDSILVREVAKLAKQSGINIGQNRLWEILRNKGYVCKNSCEPTQKAMDLKLFEVVIRTVSSGGMTRETRTTKVTGKGQVYFINKLINEWSSEV